LPGVGSFSSAQQIMSKFKKTIAKDAKKGLPLFGICLGMQLMFEQSEEGKGSGIGLFKGTVLRFDSENGLKVPHMGWNRVLLEKNSRHALGLPSAGWAYFAHSFYPRPEDDSIITATTSYGSTEFPSIVMQDNILGTQYHPEKSGGFGFELISSFVNTVQTYYKT
jgi:glutamine amidotransferase